MEKTKATWNDPMLNVENAKYYLEGRLLRTRYLLNTTEFGHFYIMNDYQKNRILVPLERILQMKNVKFVRIPVVPNDRDYFDFYYGECNGSGKIHGLGAYGWCPEKDEEGDYNVTIFVGRFNDGEITDDGVYYTWSSEDAKNSFTVQGEFVVTALEDPCPVKKKSGGNRGKNSNSESGSGSGSSDSVAGYVGCAVIIIAILVGIFVKWWVGLILFFVAGYLFDREG